MPTDIANGRPGDETAPSALTSSIEQAREAARLAGIEPDSAWLADEGYSRANASYAYELTGLQDGPQLADIEEALEATPGVLAQLNYSSSMAWITAPAELDPERLEDVFQAFGVTATMTDATLRRRALRGEMERRSPRLSTRGMSGRIRKRRKHAQEEITAAREAGFVRRATRSASNSDVLFTARDLVTPTRLVMAIVLSLPVIVLSYGPALQFPGWQWLCFALATPVALWCALPFHRAMAGGVRRGMSALDGASSIAVLAAYVWSAAALLFTGAGEIGWTSSGGWMPTRRGEDIELFLDVACGVTMLLLVGRYNTKRVGERLVDRMERLTPPAETEYTVTRRGKHTEESLPISEINRGDDVQLGRGAIVPVDGEIIGGTALVSHLLFDDPTHTKVKVGDRIAAGSRVERGNLKVRADRTGHATRWAEVSRWVADATKRQNAATMLSTKSAGMLIPTAYVLAVLDFGLWLLFTGDYNAAFSTALAILAVIAPVALAISPALATRNGIEAAARNGILVRDGTTLRNLDDVDTVVFNRVGTLVEREMTVETVTAARGEDSELVLLVAAALLVESNHPASRAIVAAAREAKGFGLPWRVEPESSNIHADGRCEGRVIVRPAANHHEKAGEEQTTYLDAVLWRPTNLSRLSGRLAMAATTGGAPIVVRWKGKDRGVITLHDPAKGDAIEAVDRLEAMGVNTVMLTRDTYAVGRRFADMMGITSVLAGITAQDKPGAVRQLHTRGANMAVVGTASVMDVVAVADVGIIYAEDEFFDRGFKRAETVADVVLIRDDVSAVPQVIEHGRRVSRIIDSNMIFANLYNVVAVGLAAFGVMPPMGATLLMLGSSLIIEYRSINARRFPQ
ncbi:HAD family hydrolase [Corynebacterium sp. TA-R-1]|uniref:HAD family hydrolase n=1 Tax=Corynebacterium stercoris TaxID=2943490 RepID=A0ABT1G238_9CORY|nr:HAD family hydrolase [Corynebacterium stercoris]